MATETINLIANNYNAPGAFKGSGHALNKTIYIIVKNKQRSLNPQLRTYGYPKYFCFVYYTSVPHFILFPFHSIPYCEIYSTPNFLHCSIPNFSQNLFKFYSFYTVPTIIIILLLYNS